MRYQTPLATAAVLAALALAGCGTAASTSTPRPPPSQAASTSAPATSAPASPQFTDPNGETCPAADSLGYCGDDDPAPATTAPAVTAAQADLTAWCAGPGYSAFTTVESDMGQFSTDSGNNDLIAVEQDGTQLFSDAHTAGLNLPPRSDSHAFGYGIYMGYLLVAGYRASNGNIDGSVSAMQQAQKHLSDVSSINTSCGGTS